MSRAQEQRVYLESLLRGYRGLVAKGAPLQSGPSRNAVMVRWKPLRVNYTLLQASKGKMLEPGLLRSNHPDVKNKDQQIARAAAMVASLKSVPVAVQDESTHASATHVDGPDDDSSIAQLRSQLEANRLEIDHLSADEKSLRLRSRSTRTV